MDPSPQDRPNILWIMTDQFNADCLSVASHPQVRTPNLDRLAARGIRFTEAYCQYPQCTPSRVSMLSGQYCKTHRMYGFVGELGSEPPHLFTHLGAQGYRTGAFGKLHIEVLGHHFQPDRCSPSMSIDWFQAKPSGHHYGAYLEDHGLSYPTHETHGGYGHCTPQSRPNIADVPPEHNLEKWTADETIAFIEECHAEQRPFLGWMSFERPHKPLNIPAEREGRFDPAAIVLDPPETAAQLLLKPRICLEGRIDPCSDTGSTPDEFRALLARYFTVIEMIDEQVGRVLDRLDALGLADNTAIVLCADHGEQAGRKRIFDKCQHASSNQLCRIPFILCPPADMAGSVRAGTVVDAPVESIDLYPTFCDWAGVPAPSHLEGRSLAPLCAGKSEPEADRCAFTESYFRRAVVKDGWRLVSHLGGSVHELYHLADDPLEYDNLYLRPGHTERIDDLKHELIRFLSEPFDADDTRYIDEAVLKDQGILHHLRHQHLHRSGCESGPFMIEGRALHVIEWKHWTLHYRVDTRRHGVFANSDALREHNLLDTPRGRWAYEELRDKVLDELMRRCVPRTYWEPEPLGAEMPTPGQVDAFLSQPLFTVDLGLVQS